MIDLKIQSNLDLNIIESFKDLFLKIDPKAIVTIKSDKNTQEDAFMHIPNDETIEAIRECESGKSGEFYNSFSDFLKEAKAESC